MADPDSPALREENAALRRRLARVEAQCLVPASDHSELRYRLLLETFPDGIVLYDPDGRVIEVNDAFERMYGWNREEWLGRRIDFVPPEENPKTMDATRRVLGGEAVRIETRRKTRDDRVLDVELRTARFTDPTGDLLGIYVIHRDITERKRRERALTESEERYRQLIEASPDAVSVYDAHGKVTYVNPAFIATFGWTLDDLAGGGIDFVPPHEADKTRDAVVRTLQGETVLLDTERYTKDGRTLHIQLKTCIFNDADGDLAGDIVIYRNLTHKRRPEAELESSREHYRTLLDVSPDPITVYDAGGRVTYVNPSFTQTFGWTLDDLAGGGIDFVPPPETEKTRDAVRRTLAGETVVLDTQRLTKHGHILDIQVKTCIFRDADGNLAGDIVVYRDLTGLKKATRELERHRDHLEALVADRTRDLTTANAQLVREAEQKIRAERALRDSEKRYRALFEAAPDAVLLADTTTGRILDANPAAEVLLGLSHDELVGRHQSELSPSDQAAVAREIFGRHASSGALAGPEEFEVVHSDGHRVPVEIVAQRLEIDGRPLLQGVFRNISERKRLEGQLLHAQKMEAVGTLAGGIAHDFRNLLQIILGYVDTLLMGLRRADAGYEALHRILKAAQRGADLTTQLLTFSRQMESRLRPVDLNAEVTEVADLLRRTIPRMVEIRLDLSPDTGLVEADPGQIEQALLNLGLNAKDAMPEGGTLTIRTDRVEADRVRDAGPPGFDGDHVVLEVSDTGHGMDPETTRHIFDPFFTTKGVGEGTGLGLATVYGIVQTHRGHISCTSRRSEGTTFTIALPCFQGALPEGAPTPEPAPEPSGEATVLVVDDEEEIRDLVRQFLELGGFAVMTAASGEEAVELYRARPDEIDAVVLDLGMPGMGGRRCLRELVTLDPEVRVLVASGYAPTHEEQEVLSLGARDFISKPYRARDLSTRLHELLGG